MKKILVAAFAATTLFPCNNAADPNKIEDNKTTNSESAPGKSTTPSI